MKEIWLESQATVLDCKKASPLLSALTFGLRPVKKYRVSYSFTAEGTLYSGKFLSAAALSENQHIPVRYSAGDPDENNLNLQNTPAKTPVVTIVVALLFLAAIVRFLLVHYRP